MLGRLCAQCGYAIQHDALDRAPPWCPKCGADLTPRPVVASAVATATATAADPSSPAPPPSSDGPAHPPPESLQDAIERIALSRFRQPEQTRRVRHTGLLLFVALFVVLAFLVALTQ